MLIQDLGRGSGGVGGGYQVWHEHCFMKYEHTAGTNEYAFTFPDYWLTYNSSQRAIALRRLLIQPSARDISMLNMYLKKDASGLKQNVGFNIALALGDDMNSMNEKMRKEIKLMVNEYKDEHVDAVFGNRDFEVKYNYSNGQLILNVLTVDTSDPYYFYFDADFESSADFKAIVGLKDDDLFKMLAQYQNGSITEAEFTVFMTQFQNVRVVFYDGTTKPQTIIFNNVWSRSSLFVSSSLSTFAESNFLAVSNESFSPPKYFEVTGFSKNFSIQLHDLNQNSPIELPDDGKDRIVIEMILTSK